MLRQGRSLPSESAVSARPFRHADCTHKDAGCSDAPAVADELPLASNPVVAADAALAAGALPVAAAPTRQTGAAVQQPEYRSRGVETSMTAAHPADIVVAGTVRGADLRRAADGIGSAALGKVPDPAGNGHLSEHARAGWQADAHGCGAGSGEIVPARGARQHRRGPRRLRRQRLGCPTSDDRSPLTCQRDQRHADELFARAHLHSILAIVWLLLRNALCASAQLESPGKSAVRR